jgi:hypothetical protein
MKIVNVSAGVNPLSATKVRSQDATVLYSEFVDTAYES